MHYEPAGNALSLTTDIQHGEVQLIIAPTALPEFSAPLLIVMATMIVSFLVLKLGKQKMEGKIHNTSKIHAHGPGDNLESSLKRSEN